MYEVFYGLRERPFNITPDPEFLFPSRRHKLALDQVTYGVTRREGFSLIIGDVGTGKTTLCRSLLGRLAGTVRTALVLNPMLSEEDLLRTILQDFGVHGPDDTGGGAEGAASSPPAPRDPGWIHRLSKKELLDELNSFLLRRAQEDVFCVLILDEAQNLSSSCLEQLRMLSNLETTKKKLLQIIFVGQLELGKRLKSRAMKALNQRISVRNRIEPLSRKETTDYIYHRLRVARAPRDLTFTRTALAGIYRHSRGYPRMINLICDRALLAGFTERSYRINWPMVRKAVNVLQERAELMLPPHLIPRVLVPIAAVFLIAMLTAFFSPVSSWIGRPGANESRSPVSERTSAPTVNARIPAASTVPVKSEPARVPSAPAPSSDIAGPTRATPPPEAASAARSRGRETYSIQVHSFKSREVADETVTSMQQDGYKVRLRQNGAWFVIFVEPFADPESARASAEEIAQRYGASPIIRRFSGNQETGSQPQ